MTIRVLVDLHLQVKGSDVIHLNQRRLKQTL